jgi:hypothetical protein
MAERRRGCFAARSCSPWNLTRLYLGDYYRTYPVTVEDEVTAALARPEDFQHGPTHHPRHAEPAKRLRRDRRQLRLGSLARRCPPFAQALADLL